jgi:hypothetical protein
MLVMEECKIVGSPKKKVLKMTPEGKKKGSEGESYERQILWFRR